MNIGLIKIYLSIHFNRYWHLLGASPFIVSSTRPFYFSTLLKFCFWISLIAHYPGSLKYKTICHIMVYCYINIKYYKQWIKHPCFNYVRDGKYLLEYCTVKVLRSFVPWFWSQRTGSNVGWVAVVIPRSKNTQ